MTQTIQHPNIITIELKEKLIRFINGWHVTDHKQNKQSTNTRISLDFLARTACLRAISMALVTFSLRGSKSFARHYLLLK